MLGHEDFAPEGADRIEFNTRLGREIRVGSLPELSVADLDRVEELLNSGEKIQAENRLSYLHGLYQGLISCYVEWTLNWHIFIKEKLSVDAARTVTEAVFETWRDNLKVSYEAERAGLVTTLLSMLNPDNIDAVTANQFMVDANGNTSLANPELDVLSAEVNAVPEQSYQFLMGAIANDNFHIATAYFETYVEHVRSRHDLLVEIVWLFISTVGKFYGQAIAEEGLYKSLSSCSYYEDAWSAIINSTPAQRVVLIAEELRIHFSGLNRRGQVKIIEETDRYRLIFEPCGSGGVQRQNIFRAALNRPNPDLANKRSLGDDTFNTDSPSTWGETGIPPYCMHCAQNELTSMKRLGYPAWVTEFDRNTMNPCGWTVYKDPAKIPEKYFLRLGVKKP